MAQNLNDENKPLWRLASGYKIKHVGAVYSKTKAVVLWEQYSKVSNDFAECIIVCGSKGERLSPIYKQRHSIYQAAFAIHEKYHIVRCMRDKDKAIEVRLYKINNIEQGYPCPGWNATKPAKYNKLQTGTQVCPTCKTHLKPTDKENVIIHPMEGWVSTTRPYACLEEVVYSPSYQDNGWPSAFVEFKPAVESAVRKTMQFYNKPVYMEGKL